MFLLRRCRTLSAAESASRASSSWPWPNRQEPQGIPGHQLDHGFPLGGESWVRAVETPLRGLEVPHPDEFIRLDDEGGKDDRVVRPAVVPGDLNCLVGEPDPTLDGLSSHDLGDSEGGETADLDVWPLDPASQCNGFFQVVARIRKVEGPELRDPEIHQCGRPVVGRTVHFVRRLRSEYLLQRAHCVERRLQIATPARERQLRACQA